MELLYLWIENYKNIERQGFNFSPQYRFEYDDKTETLTVSENSNYIPNFFPEGISNVTAIVGENGAGKSTLLKFLMEIEGVDFKMGRFMAVYLSKSLVEKHIHVYRAVDLKVNIPQDCKDKFKFNMETFEKGKFYDIHNINNKKYFIFYSNTFDNIEYNLPNAVNISNKYLQWRSVAAQESGTGVLLGSLGIESSYTANKMEKQARFLADIEKIDKKNTIKIPFQIPDSLDIQITYHFTDAVGRNITPLYRNRETRLDKFDFLHRLYENIALCIFNIILRDGTGKPEEEADEISKFNEIFTEQPDEASIDIYIKYAESKIKSIGQVERLSFLQRFLNSTSFDISKKIENKEIEEIEYNKGGWSYIRIPLNENNNGFIYDFIFYTSPFDMVSFGWSKNGKSIQLSSGENTMLDIMSRFYRSLTGEINLAGHTKVFVNALDNLTILIDEGELSLHPQWQKQYMDMLIKLCSVVFGEIKIGKFKSIAKKFQIILTSHSPFIVSDLPNENIIFLEKSKENGKCVVKNSLNDMKQTFGANIHTLLTDSFFMQDGLMGDFAKGKILEIYNFLKGNIENKLEEKYIENVIKSIGEPIIKNELDKLFIEKYKGNLKVLEGFYENRLNEIREKIRKGGAND